MPSKPKEISPKDAGYQSWYSVRIKEELAFWTVDSGWDPAMLKEAGLRLLAVSAKTDASVGEGYERRYKKNAALNLKCGVQIDSGLEKSSPQKQTMTLTNVRVDDVQQANDMLVELSKIKGFKTWEIQSLEVYNPKKGITLYFKRFNPDGTGVQLYLHALETHDSYRYYYDVPPYEQQDACNHIQEQIAHCERKEKTVYSTKCVLQRHLEKKREAA